MKSFGEILIQLIKSHIEKLFTGLDLVQEEEKLEYSPKATYNINWHYVCAFTNFILVCLVGSFGLQYEVEPDQMNLSAVFASPYMFLHQTFPRVIWPQTDK